MATAAVQTSGTPVLELIPIADLRESKHNTRKLFDEGKLQELKSSIEKSGILTPLLVRPQNGHFEIAGGHRRFRAAKLAGAKEVPCLVRELDDATFLEVLTIDNLQREDVHPLEEAQGYKNLLTLDGYDIKKVADRVGKSDSYVYDRMKLLQLIKPAQKLFLENGFSAGHAILIARLSKEDQERLIDENDGPLWEGDYGHDPIGVQDELGLEHEPGERSKPISVRALQSWIDDHIRFTAPDPSTPHLFGETVENLEKVKTEKVKLIEISRDHMLKDDAKHPDGQRTYCVTSWTRADGKPEVDQYGDSKPSQACDRSVMGLVVAGRGRGESFRVCIDKKKCMVHYGTEIRARNKREDERERAESTGTTARAARAEEARLAKERKDEEQRKREADAWTKAQPLILERFGAAIRKAPTGPHSPIVKLVWSMFQRGFWGLDGYSKHAAKYVPIGSSASTVLQHIVMCLLLERDASALEHYSKSLKLGVDVQGIVRSFLPPTPKGTPKSTTKAKKKAGKR
jgi:ParB/RepB/Spo0J family partition protein